MSQVSWKDAIRTVLRDHGGELHYSEIADRIIDRRLRSKVGATPAATVSANLTAHLAGEVERTGRGYYRLAKAQPDRGGADEALVAVGESAEPGGSSGSAEMGCINAFGIFWRREEVLWQGDVRLWGVQQVGAERVDFGGQSGVYILYDASRVVYVGQATSGRLGQRLKEHTADRLHTRWDRFSWFGVDAVNEDGTLRSCEDRQTTTVDLISTLEALLIEGLEPPLNRRRGDGFNDVEFIQELDPKVQAKREELAVQSVLARSRNGGI